MDRSVQTKVKNDGNNVIDIDSAGDDKHDLSADEFYSEEEFSNDGT